MTDRTNYEDDEEFKVEKGIGIRSPRAETGFIAEAVARHSALPVRHPVLYNTRDNTLLLECGHYVFLLAVEAPSLEVDVSRLRIRCQYCYEIKMRHAEHLVKSVA
jgi:hypothetical protein